MVTKAGLQRARKRDLISPEVAAQVSRDTKRDCCVACARGFRRRGFPRLFGCACCVKAYGPPGERDRRIGRGMRVVVLETGETGVVQSVPPSAEQAVVQLEKSKQTITATAGQMERIFTLQVAHYLGCGHAPGKSATREGDHGEAGERV